MPLVPPDAKCRVDGGFLQATCVNPIFAHGRYRERMGFGEFLGRMGAILLLALLACGGASARAATLDGGLPLESCIARLDPGTDAAGVIANPYAFNCAVRQNSLGSGNFVTWLRFSPIADRQDDPLVLRHASVWQDAERIHFRYADGVEAVQEFTQAETSRFLTVGAMLEFPIPQRAAPLSAVYVETYGSANLRGALLGAQVMPMSVAYRAKLAMTAIYAGFAGLALALFVYNLSHWVALRARFQLDYCMMVAALGAYTFSSSGVLMMVLPSLANNDRLRINYVLLAAAGLAALRFMASFFDVRENWPGLYRAMGTIGGFAVVAALCFAAFAPLAIAPLDRLYFMGLGAMLFTVVPLMIKVQRSGNPHFTLFVIAWAAPFTISLLRLVHGFNLIGYSIVLDNGNMAAMIIEALLSSMMVIARLKALSSERDHAVAGEQVARRLANTDPLTGLLNRRAFLDIAIGRRNVNRLMLIDIDHFKRVNDNLGHEAGDRVLEAVADAIQQCRSLRSLAVRLGGEEVAMLVPRSEAKDCTAEMILEAVRRHPMPQGMTVTVSIGWSEGTLTSEDDWKRLYRLADAALYRAKSDGRDRACRATDFRVVA